MSTSRSTGRARLPADSQLPDDAGAAFEISGELLQRLKHDLACRRIGAGITWLQSHANHIHALRPEQPRAATFVGCLAQWVDMGFARPALIRDLLSRFTLSTRAALPVADYLHLRMAEGMSAMANGETDEALRHLDFALVVGEELGDTETLAIANFWKGRSLRKKGEYDEALTSTSRAEQLAIRLGYPKLAAVMQVLESWMVFQKGRTKEALVLLRQAEAVLADTDDYLALGNIHSSYRPDRPPSTAVRPGDLVFRESDRFIPETGSAAPQPRTHPGQHRDRPAVHRNSAARCHRRGDAPQPRGR